MDLKVFAEKIQKEVAGKLGEGYEVRLQEVCKNNGVILQGMLILTKDCNVSPTIYLNSFWEAYEGGVTMQNILDKIIQVYEQDTPKTDVDMSFFREFEQVKDGICYKLISAEQNRELLETIPHKEYLDLAICFYYAYRGGVLGNGSIQVYNSHLELWNTDVEELFLLAQENTPRLFPAEDSAMVDVIREMVSDPDSLTEIVPEDIPMRVLGNKEKTFGAACVLYPGFLEKIASTRKQGFYLIPSSVHEMILLENGGQEDVKELRSMIEEVNLSQVEPEEVLSNQLYFYEPSEGLKIIF